MTKAPHIVTNDKSAPHNAKSHRSIIWCYCKTVQTFHTGAIWLSFSCGLDLVFVTSECVLIIYPHWFWTGWLNLRATFYVTSKLLILICLSIKTYSVFTLLSLMQIMVRIWKVIKLSIIFCRINDCQLYSLVFNKDRQVSRQPIFLFLCFQSCLLRSVKLANSSQLLDSSNQLVVTNYLIWEKLVTSNNM